MVTIKPRPELTRSNDSLEGHVAAPVAAEFQGSML